MQHALPMVFLASLCVTEACYSQTKIGRGYEITSYDKLTAPQFSYNSTSDAIQQNELRLNSDSLNTSNKISWEDIFSGFSYYGRHSASYYSTNPLLEMFNFNTVEGFNVNLGLKYRKGNKEAKSFSWSSYFRYGFSNQRANIKSALSFSNNSKQRQSFYIEGGRYVYQFNHNNPIHSFINSYYSLGLRENYMKLYGSQFGRARFGQELFDGASLEAGILYEDREPLSNNTNFSLRKENLDGRIEYTSNDPVKFANVNKPFYQHQALILDVKLELKFRQQYISSLDLQVPMGSEYPDITLNYKKGINAAGSDINYDFGSINIGQNLDFGFFGLSSWDVNAGTFFNVNSIQLIDYQHFNGNQTIFISYSEPFGEDREPLNRFQLLDYYAYSTTGSYWVVHSEHHFNGYIMNKIPIMKRINSQLVAGLNFLQTSDDVVHFEFSAGLENIFEIFRVDFVTGYNNYEKLKGALRLRLELEGDY